MASTSNTKRVTAPDFTRRLRPTPRRGNGASWSLSIATRCDDGRDGRRSLWQSGSSKQSRRNSGPVQKLHKPRARRSSSPRHQASHARLRVRGRVHGCSRRRGAWPGSDRLRRRARGVPDAGKADWIYRNTRCPPTVAFRVPRWGATAPCTVPVRTAVPPPRRVASLTPGITVLTPPSPHNPFQSSPRSTSHMPQSAGCTVFRANFRANCPGRETRGVRFQVGIAHRTQRRAHRNRAHDLRDRKSKGPGEFRDVRG